METKVSQWETKLAQVRATGDEERIRMAEDTLRKAKAKVAEKEEAIEPLDRSVQRTELLLAMTVEKVKEEEEDEVVEVEVEDEEMEEGMVKEEVEAKTVVETPAEGGAEAVAQGNDAVEGCGGHLGPAMGPGLPGWPPPPKPGHPPPCRPGESGLDSPVFVAAGAPPAVWGGGGRWVWRRRRRRSACRGPTYGEPWRRLSGAPRRLCRGSPPSYLR